MIGSSVVARGRWWVACAGGLAAVWLASACKVPNEDHCLHRADDANAWCAEHHEELSYCSPCEAVDDGCVASEPSEELCPDYAQGGTGGEGATETDSDAGSDTGTGTGTGTVAVFGS